MKTYTDKERDEITRTCRDAALKVHAILETYDHSIRGAVVMELVAFWLAGWDAEDQDSVMADFRDSGCDLILKIAKSISAANENRSH